jgi:acyl-CoA synthetase (NDP forming)
VAEAAAATQTPVIVSQLGTGQVEKASIELINSHQWLLSIPVARDALRAIRLCAEREAAGGPMTAGPPRQVSAKVQWGDEVGVKDALMSRSAAQHVLTPPRLIFDAPWHPEQVADAVTFASCYLKVTARSVMHKSDANLIRGPLTTRAEILTATSDLLGAVADDGISEARLLVEETAPHGTDLFLALSRTDQQQYVLIGAGGIDVERSEQVQVLAEPVAGRTVSRIISSLIADNGVAMSVLAISGVTALLAAMRQLADSERLAELECNPIRIDDRGQVWVLDALAIRPTASVPHQSTIHGLEASNIHD